MKFPLAEKHPGHFAAGNSNFRDGSTEGTTDPKKASGAKASRPVESIVGYLIFAVDLSNEYPLALNLKMFYLLYNTGEWLILTSTSAIPINYI
jgi:hypothetical protein